MRLGKVIRAWREAERMSLRDAALEIGIDWNTLARLESGEKTHDVNTWIIVTNWLAGK